MKRLITMEEVDRYFGFDRMTHEEIKAEADRSWRAMTEEQKTQAVDRLMSIANDPDLEYE